MNNMNKPLTSFLERVEALLEQRKEINDDIKDIYTEAKGQGFDPATMKEMLKLRRLDAEARREKEDMRDAYLNALDLV